MDGWMDGWLDGRRLCADGTLKSHRSRCSEPSASHPKLATHRLNAFWHARAHTHTHAVCVCACVSWRPSLPKDPESVCVSPRHE
eukprot:588669-Rhodomonas_salina.2